MRRRAAHKQALRPTSRSGDHTKTRVVRPPLRRPPCDWRVVSQRSQCGVLYRETHGCGLKTHLYGGDRISPQRGDTGALLESIAREQSRLAAASSKHGCGHTRLLHVRPTLGNIRPHDPYRVTGERTRALPPVIRPIGPIPAFLVVPKTGLFAAVAMQHEALERPRCRHHRAIPRRGNVNAKKAGFQRRGAHGRQRAT